MPQPKPSPLLGASAGLLAGLAASWIMSKFQSILSSTSHQTQQQDEPANVKAAEKLARATIGHELTKPEKQAGGLLMHYAVGGLSGAAYGAIAPIVPLPNVAAGAIFGTAVWAIADEVVVPALGLSKPTAEYPVSTHSSALAAHLVYGVSTALLCREILQSLEAGPVTIRRAAITGAISGLRSMTGPLFALLRQRRFPAATRLFGVLAAGELIADKLPKVPARIKPGPLAGRALAGGLSGAAIFHAEEADPVAGAVIGAAAAIGASYVGYQLRHAAVEKGMPDFAYALAEDALALSVFRETSCRDARAGRARELAFRVQPAASRVHDNRGANLIEAEIRIAPTLPTSRTMTFANTVKPPARVRPLAFCEPEMSRSPFCFACAWRNAPRPMTSATCTCSRRTRRIPCR